MNTKFKSKFRVNRFILLAILLLASFFRLYGVNWDQGHHLHPDERFLTMVETSIKIPASIGDYLNPQVSTMSPYNNNFNFFVYGTLPLNLVKVLGEWTKQNTYDTIYLLGRQVSAFFDIGVVMLVFLIGRRLWSEKVGLWSAFLYSIMVLPIQLSHFFAVDTFLNFFIVLSFYFLVLLLTPHPHFPTHITRPTSQFLLSGALGISFGCALACKISAIYFAPIIALGFLFLFIKSIKLINLLTFIVCCLLFVLATLLAFRFGHPSAFETGNMFNWQPNQEFMKNIEELENMNNANSWIPPIVQWKSAKPIWFPFGNLTMWGLGLPMGLFAVVSLLFSITQLIISPKLMRRVSPGVKYSPVQLSEATTSSGQIIPNTLILLWIIGLFFYQGTQPVTTMRYFLIIYPFVALMLGPFVVNYVFPKIKRQTNHFYIFTQTVFCMLLLVYPLSFLSIYTRPVTRISASEWIFDNVPKGSTIVNEEWDDGLPLNLGPNKSWQSHDYIGKSVFMYDEDTPEKWARLQPIIDQADYYITSSNRAYGGLMRLPKRNPETIQFYEGLFNGTGDFYKAAEFTSRPCFPFWLPSDKQWFCYNDDNAEEAFTVYDHPKVMIFKSKRAGE